jgi:hypothetical protein
VFHRLAACATGWPWGAASPYKKMLLSVATASSTGRRLARRKFLLDHADGRTSHHLGNRVDIDRPEHAVVDALTEDLDKLPIPESRAVCSLLRSRCLTAWSLIRNSKTT